MSRDEIFRSEQSKVQPFEFNTQVAFVFDDMISRSVPAYGQVQRLSAQIAAKFYQPGTAVYDLGCSTGTTLIEILKLISDPQLKLIGLDNSAAMLEQCAKKLSALGFKGRAELCEADLADLTAKNASTVICNYTLQFVAPDKRPEILSRIHAGLRAGGAFVLTEKVREADAELEKLTTDLYYDFKRANGYSELEISQKREALENVLVPLTLEENFELLKRAGFTGVTLLQKHLPFCTFLAKKNS